MLAASGGFLLGRIFRYVELQCLEDIFLIRGYVRPNFRRERQADNTRNSTSEF